MEITSKPSRINPDVVPTESRIVAFRDGPRLVPDYMTKEITANAYPDLTFQEWVNKVANKKMETRAVGQALGLLRLSHFGR